MSLLLFAATLSGTVIVGVTMTGARSTVGLPSAILPGASDEGIKAGGVGDCVSFVARHDESRPPRHCAHSG